VAVQLQVRSQSKQTASGAELTLFWCFIATTALRYSKISVGLELGTVKRNG
jgi:hypothetical protein